jgi:cytoskeletal protein CcmA (bactofilin family)
MGNAADNIPVAVAVLGSNEDLTLSGQNVTGSIFGAGNVSVSGKNVTGGGVYALGDITLSQCTVDGDVYANGNVTLNYGVTVAGDVLCRRDSGDHRTEHRERHDLFGRERDA